MAALSSDGLFRVNGLVALITGGGTGIGLMTAKALALNGASKKFLKKPSKQSPHGNIIPLPADFSKQEDCRAVAEYIRQDTGYLNLMFANAGTSGPQVQQDAGSSVKEVQERAMSTTMEEWETCFRVNVYGCYFSIMAVLDLLDEGNKQKNFWNGEVKSQVIVTGSIGAYSRIVGAGNAYRASKAAVTHLAKCLSTGFQTFGIRVNTLAPGLFPSEMAGPLIQKFSAGARDGEIDPKIIPAQRVGCEQDMAGTLLYLVSRAGAYNNGGVFVVDGGRLSVQPSSY